MYKYIILIIMILGFSGCSDKQEDEINIGFVAGLSGKYSSLGVSVRDGFIMAFEEINNTIDGKKVRIIQKDDKQDEAEAKQVVDFFVNNNIKLIVGNTTSSMTKVTLENIKNKDDMLLISATASSSEFSQQDDNFLRVQVDNSPNRFSSLAKVLVDRGYKKIFCIYDSKNKVYANDYTNTLESVFIENGGSQYVAKMDLNDKYQDILAKVNKTDNDLILIVGNAVDSANMIQYLRVKNITTKILASGWAKTMDFITNGGASVEGVIFSEGYNDDSKDEKFISFVEKFKKRYDIMPSVFAIQGYELAQILIQNLEKSSNIADLKKNILKVKRYEGLQGNIIFDKYGDVMREFFIMEVKNKKFVRKN